VGRGVLRAFDRPVWRKPLARFASWEAYSRAPSFVDFHFFPCLGLRPEFVRSV